MIKCSINSNIKLEENPEEILVGHYSPIEILEKIGLTENSTWSETQEALHKVFEEELNELDPDRESQVYFGIMELCGASGLGFGYLKCWIKVGIGPKVCFFLYINSDEEVDAYIPVRGNPFGDEDFNPPDEETLVEQLGPLPGEMGIDKFFELGLLEPDWEAAETEFIAYQRYVY